MELLGGAKMLSVGSRAQVLHGTAKRTSGGLTKDDLMKNKWGKIVSKKASKAARKSKNLANAGYTAKKGEFGAYKKKDGKLVKVRGSRKSRK